MYINASKFFILFFSLFILAVSFPIYAQDDIEYVEMDTLREKISEDKKIIVGLNMNLTKAEEKEFWPIYESYQDELHKINVRLLAVIKDYASAYNQGPVSNEKAEGLLKESIAIDWEEVKLKERYISIFGKVLPIAKVARYIQIENKIRAVIRYQIADGLPLLD